MSLPPTTTSLIDDLKAENPAAWQRFTRIYAPVIFAICKEFAPDQADDLTQEIVSRIRNGIPRFERRPGQRFRNYVQRITRNRIDDYRRQRERHQARLEKRQFDSKYREFEIRNAIHDARQHRRIAEKSWQAFLLWHEQGLSDDDIANVLGMKKDTVRKARERVVQAVQDELDDFITWK